MAHERLLFCLQARLGRRHTAALCFAKALALCLDASNDQVHPPGLVNRDQDSPHPITTLIFGFILWCAWRCSCLESASPPLFVNAAACAHPVYSPTRQC